MPHAARGLVMRVAWPLVSLGALASAGTLATVAALGGGCASVLALPDKTPSFCARPENQGHDYCEDFDVGDPSTRWTFAEPPFAGSQLTIAPSDDSPPNLVDLSSPSVGPGQSALAGFTKEFDDAPSFAGVHVEADVRLVTHPGQDAGPYGVLAGGFLLITDKSGGCIGIGFGVDCAGKRQIGAVILPEATSCSALTGGGGGGPPGDGGGAGDAGAGGDAGVCGAQGGTASLPGFQQVLAPAPSPDTWVHVKVIVSPDTTKNDGSGTLSFNIVGLPSSTPNVPLPAKMLVPTGTPLVGFAAQVIGPSDALEVQFDNIWIDLRGN